MNEKERAFRERIARIQRIQKLEEQYSKENKQDTKEDKLNEILPAICGIKKSIENFRTKEIIEETEITL